MDHPESRSAAVQEVLDPVPKGLLRWGNSLFLVIGLILLILSILIKYPDYIVAEVQLKNTSPLVYVRASHDGTMEQIMVSEGQFVKMGDEMIRFTFQGDHDTVLELKRQLDSLPNSGMFAAIIQSELGELSYPFTRFYSTCQSFLSTINYASKDPEQSTDRYQFNSSFHHVLSDHHRLKKAIQKWSGRYILNAPVDGEVQFGKQLNYTDSIRVGDHLFTLFPEGKSKNNGTVFLKAAELNHLQVGQRINFQSDPSSTFSGMVTNISSTTNESGIYKVDFSINEDLSALYIDHLDQELSIKVQISTSDIRLFDRIKTKLINSLNPSY